jgi:methylmalonyl-CoA carboxyltransferase large subunit
MTMIETPPHLELDSDATELHALLKDLRQQLASLSERVDGLEKLASPAVQQLVTKPETPAAVVAAEPKPTPAIAVEAGITEEEVLAISAALAAWLGVHAHIRQIRLIRSGAWAQQGRASIQASHGLHR